MTIGDTLLKITDYPFAYSLMAILFASNGLELLSKDSLVFLGIAGAIGTILTIIDPVGFIIMRYMKWVEKIAFFFFSNPNAQETRTFRLLQKINPKLKEQSRICKNWEEVENAFHTKSIELEKEKIVSSYYFLILIVFTYIMIGHFGAIENNSNYWAIQKICDVSCVKDYSSITLIIISVILVIIISLNAGKIFKKVRTVSTYLMGINHPVVTKTSIENLSRFIESGDWKTAEYWRNIVETEFLNEQGLVEERGEKLKNHMNALIGQFKQHKNYIDENNNRSLINSLTNRKTSSKEVLTIDMLCTFSNYKNLLEHFYTDTSLMRYNKIYKVLELDEKFKNSLNDTNAKINEGVENILKKLSEYSSDVSNAISKNGGPWINLKLLIEHLECFVQTTNKDIIPISENPDYHLFQVRIFDHREYEGYGQDVIAELYQSDAEILTKELHELSNKIRNENSVFTTTWLELRKAEEDLKQMINELLLSYELMTIPIRGSCNYCRNEEFWSKTSIVNDENKVKEISPIMYTKQKI
ncbi:MAG: hypothetical protein KC444_01835 [Nitrosopumilus sp.]|nr:hypothetical protein [Nitrosopumilus sp.]